MGPGRVGARGPFMADEENLTKVVRDELGRRGYVINVNARREGEFIVGKVHVTNAETEETVAKLVGVGNVDGFQMCFGIDAEGTIRDAILRVLSTWQGMQNLMPAVVIKPPRP